jgi:uncharacterized protein YgbK (DUF1537 family)
MKPDDPGMSARKQSICTVIADDLTGACDAAVQFANLGYSTLVVLDWSSIEDCDAEVIAASTDSRRDMPEEAARKVERLAGILSRRQSPLIFKKIDSTLRGNVAAEIEASMKAFGCRTGVIAPAFPAMGRTVSDGWLRVERSASPPIHLPTLLKEQGLAGIAHADRAVLSAGADRLQERVAGWCNGGARLIVFDSNSDSDLETAIKSCARLRPDPLWVGSAGLARALANHFSGKGSMPRIKPTPPDKRSAVKGSVVLCIGTDHPVTEEQLGVLSASRPVTITLADQSGLPGAERALQEGRILLVRIEPGKTNEDTVRKFLAGLNGTRIQGLLLSGGDTASLVCAALNARFIRLNAEIMDGVPWGWFDGGLQDGLPLATKSGGFGSADTLVGVVDFLSSCPRA